MFGPQININLDIIEENTAYIASLCAKHDIAVTGVTKGTCAMPMVAKAMLRGGLASLADSRLENVQRLRKNGIDCPIILLRSPTHSNFENVIRDVDISLNSELKVIEELARVARRMGRVHEIILMVDLGDLREGVWPDKLVESVEKIKNLHGVKLVGIGTNLSCFGAVLPTVENMSQLVAYAQTTEQILGYRLQYISGGNSTSLPLVRTNAMPTYVNHLRIGEAILQGGRDSFEAPWPQLNQNAFVLQAELLEVKTKPSKPLGKTGVNAFGQQPVFDDKGERLRGILNIGREDIIVEDLIPNNPDVHVLGASSDHLVVDLQDTNPPLQVGDSITFQMRYGALLAAMTSAYVIKECRLLDSEKSQQKKLDIYIPPQDKAKYATPFLHETLKAIDYDCQVTSSLDVAPKRNLLVMTSNYADNAQALQNFSSNYNSIGILWFSPWAGLQTDNSDSPLLNNTNFLYHVLGFSHQAVSLRAKVSLENIVLIGLRSATSDEVSLIKDSGVQVFTIEDIDALGIREVMRQAIQIVRSGTQGTYVSYDVSLTDMPDNPKGAGGITIRETHQAMESIAMSEDVRAICINGLVENQSDIISSHLIQFAASGFGKRIL